MKNAIQCWGQKMLVVGLLTSLMMVSASFAQGFQEPKEAWKLIVNFPLERLYEFLEVGDSAFAIGEGFGGGHVLVQLKRGQTQPSFRVRVESSDFGRIRSGAELHLAFVEIQRSRPGKTQDRDAQDLGYLLLLAVVDDTTPYYLQSELWLYLWLIRKGDLRDELQKVKLGETSVALREEDPTGTWAYMAGPRVDVGDLESVPALRTFIRVFADDYDKDGYQDLILRTRICRSREMEEVEAGTATEESFCPYAFALAEDKLEILPFNPEDMRLSARRSLEGAELSHYTWADGMTIAPYDEPLE